MFLNFVEKIFDTTPKKEKKKRARNFTFFPEKL